MKRKSFKHWGLFIALQFITLSLFAQGPNNTGTYYQSANGLKGKALKTAMFNIIKTHKELSYKGLWTAFRTTDMREDGKVWDMYSDKTNYVFGSSAQGANYKREGDSYNREHSFPKSWFNDAKPMYTDLVHLVPTDGYVNNRRGNLPFGETEGDTYKSNNSFCKVGTCTYRLTRFLQTLQGLANEDADGMVEERPGKPKGNKPQQGHPISAEQPQPLRRLSWPGGIYLGKHAERSLLVRQLPGRDEHSFHRVRGRAHLS